MTPIGCIRNPAEYNRLVAIRKVSDSASADAHGFIDKSDDSNWETLTETWAKVETKGGREFWKYDRVEADVSHVWHCPYSSILATADPTMRIRYNDVDHNIVSIVNIDEANVEFEIQTKRAV